MSELIKLEKINGKIVRSKNVAPSQGVKLTCRVTGKSRPSNIAYLKNKADKHNISIEEVVANYVCREGIKILKLSQNPQKDFLININS